MEQHRPDRQAVVGHVDLFPMLAAVGAAIGPGLRARVHDLGLLRMHRQRPHRRHLGQPARERLPFLAAVGHAEQAGIDDAAGPGLAGQSQINV